MKADGQNRTSFKDVVLRGAKIRGLIDMSGANVDGTLDADSLEVDGFLFMRSNSQNKARFKDVVLRGAKVRGLIDMSGAKVDGRLDADSLGAGGDLFMRDAHFAQEVVMEFAHVGRNLDLRGGTLAGLDLSGASIAADLRLGGPYKSTPWKEINGEPGALHLVNAHIGNLVDAEDAWPTQNHLQIYGFSFGHLGGFGKEDGEKIRGRNERWWDNWARLDPEYSPALYAQLAAALTSLGARDVADEIRYFGRERERELAWREHKWGTWLILSTLNYGFGYEIGAIGFLAVFWVLAFSLTGAMLLWFTVPAARTAHRGLLWCFGASLARLLPVIEINKEFTDFFDDAERQRLKAWQSILFSGLRLVGWVLGAAVIAAVSGLTQSS
jgi:hypothetical protein